VITLTDTARERRIVQLGSACKNAMAQRRPGAALLAWRGMVALINGRSLQQVERMERARGFDIQGSVAELLRWHP